MEKAKSYQQLLAEHCTSIVQQVLEDMEKNRFHVGTKPIPVPRIRADGTSGKRVCTKAAANNLGQMGQMNIDGGGSMNPAGIMMGMGVAAGMGNKWLA